MYAGNQNNGWYPYGGSRGRRKPGGSSGKTAAIVVVVLLLIGGLAGGLSYYFLTKTTTPSAESTTTQPATDEVQFLPFGPGTTDQEATNLNTISYTVPGVEYTLLGVRNGSTPVVVQPKIGRGAIFIGVLEGSTLSSTEVVKVLVHGSKDIRPMDRELGEHFYYREATSSDKAFIDCLIPNYSTTSAYLFTWEKVVAYNVDTGVYTRIGTFQAVVAFDANSTTYIIRMYASNVMDAVGATAQFKTYETYTDKRYDSNLVADDVRNKRIITPLSEAVSGLTLPRLPDNKDCVPI